MRIWHVVPALLCFVTSICGVAQALPEHVAAALRDAPEVEIINRFGQDAKLNVPVRSNSPNLVVFSDRVRLTGDLVLVDSNGSSTPNNIIVIADEIVLGPTFDARVFPRPVPSSSRNGINYIFVSRTLKLDAHPRTDVPKLRASCFPKLICFDVSAAPPLFSAPPGIPTLPSSPTPSFRTRNFGANGDVVFYFQRLEFSETFRAELMDSLRSVGETTADTFVLPKSIVQALLQLMSEENPVHRQVREQPATVMRMRTLVEGAFDWERTTRPEKFLSDRVQIFGTRYPFIPPSQGPSRPPPVMPVFTPATPSPIFESDFPALVDQLPSEIFSRWAIAHRRWLVNVGRVALTTDNPAQLRQFVDGAALALSGPIAPTHQEEFSKLAEQLKELVQKVPRYRTQQVGLVTSDGTRTVEAVVDLAAGRVEVLPDELTLNTVAYADRVFFGWVLERAAAGTGTQLRLVLEGSIEGPEGKLADSGRARGLNELRYGDLKLTNVPQATTSCGVQRDKFRCFIDLQQDDTTFLFLNQLVSEAGLDASIEWRVDGQSGIKGIRSLRLRIGSGASECLAAVPGQAVVKNVCRVPIRINNADGSKLQISANGITNAAAKARTPVELVVNSEADLGSIFRFHRISELTQTIRFAHTLYPSFAETDPLYAGALRNIVINVKLESLDGSLPPYTERVVLAPDGENAVKEIKVPRIGSTVIRFSGIAYYAKGMHMLEGEDRQDIIYIQQHHLLRR